MSSLFQLLGNDSGTNWLVILFQAVGCAMRGESPQKFMKNLANSHPQLKRVNLDDLWGSAQQLAKEEGKDINTLTKQLDEQINPMIRGGQ